MSFTEIDVTAAARLLAEGRVSAFELTRAYLGRIDRLEGTLNSFVTVMADQALAAASAADARAARGERRGPLDGIPLALKDNIDVAGVPTTNGLAARRHAVAPHDAHVVARLRAAGAVIVGKLNMHEIALGGTTDNPHLGRSANPHRPDCTPGGSSGGSGAAVAARLCAAALGTDTLGSVRLPAAYCGVSGLKPTPGLVSTRGVCPLSFRLDHVGPLARSVRDLGLLLEAVAGYDPDCAESEPARGAPTSAVPDEPDVRGLVLGRLRNVDTVPMEPDIRDAWDRALALLETLGCQVRDVELPGYDFGHARRAGLLVVECEAALAHAEDLARDPARFSPGVRAMLEYGRDAKAARLVKAERLIALARLAARTALAHVDALVLPTASQVAFPFSEPAPDHQADLTALANLAGLPAVSVPMGFSGAGLPMGLQIVGRPFTEGTVLALARAYERTAAWDMRPRGAEP
jgi:aspartyl-tRNA(Asn)/glutamyl-tRNA(Gln) amidotransferase subunit A